MRCRTRSLAVLLLVSLFLSPAFADPPEPFPSDQSLMDETTFQWIARQLRMARFGPEAIRRFNRIAAEELSPKVLDAYLWAFRGFHAGPEHRTYRMRQWVPVRVGNIGRHQVEGMTPELYATVVRIAMEIELPIVEYSLQSGAGFRLLHPNLGRFMGRDRESRAYADAHGLNWCDGPWCAEEDRHGDALSVIFQRLIGRPPARDNPAPTEDPLETLRYAIDHVDSRQSTEWIASGSYFTLLPHSKDELYAHLLNVFRDEIKHLAIMSAFDRYLRGPQPWRRLKENLAWTAYRARLHNSESEGRSGMGINYTEPIFLLEFLYANTLEELAVRRWLDSLPYSTLREVFETPSKLPDFLADKPDPAALAKWEREREEGERFRLQLTLWKPKERAAALQLWNFLMANRDALNRYVKNHLDGFKGCEEPGSPESERMRRRIRSLNAIQLAGNFALEDHAEVRAVLAEMLRTYQLANNHETRVFRGDLEPDPLRFNTKSRKNLLFAECGEGLANDGKEGAH